MTLPASVCLICGKPLSPFHDPRGPRVCGALTCQWALRTTPKDRVCLVCGSPLARSALPQRVCTEARCRERWLVEQQRRHDEQRRRWHEAFEQRAVALRTASAKAAGVADPNEYLLINIPSFRRRITRLPRRRLRSFRGHLAELIAEATARRMADAEAGQRPAPPRVPDPMSAELSDVLAKGCARCRGNCCGNGGNHAYVRVDGILRYMAAHPDSSPDQVLDAYVGHVGRKTYQNSCVYHGARGCTLPRDMRADICNTFYCHALVELRSRAPADGPVRAFLASTSGDTMTAAFVDARDVRVVRKRDRRSAIPDP